MVFTLETKTIASIQDTYSRASKVPNSIDACHIYNKTYLLNSKPNYAYLCTNLGALGICVTPLVCSRAGAFDPSLMFPLCNCVPLCRLLFLIQENITQRTKIRITPPTEDAVAMTAVLFLSNQLLPDPPPLLPESSSSSSQFCTSTGH